MLIWIEKYEYKTNSVINYVPSKPLIAIASRANASSTMITIRAPDRGVCWAANEVPRKPRIVMVSSTIVPSAAIEIQALRGCESCALFHSNYRAKKWFQRKKIRSSQRRLSWGVGYAEFNRKIWRFLLYLRLTLSFSTFENVETVVV